MIDFNEYIRQEEPGKIQRAENWKIAIGLQEVDGLKPSEYLVQMAQQHIEGRLTIEGVKQRISDYYQTQEGRELISQRTDEADKVSANIADILAEQTFSLTPAEYVRIHRRLFTGVMSHAGEYRKYNITKKEWVLDGDTVIYAPYEMLKETIEYDFAQEKQFSYKGLSKQQAITHLCSFISGLWQIHPFAEGNTRTTAVFTIKYLRKFGFAVNNTAFERHSWYFRNALVRANYTNAQKGIVDTMQYLERFFDNLLYGGENELKNRYCHILWNESETRRVANKTAESENALKNALKTIYDIPDNEGDEIFERKSALKNALKNALKIIEVISRNDSVSIDTLAEETKASRRYIVKLIKGLKEQNILRREGPDKGGHWVIV